MNKNVEKLSTAIDMVDEKYLTEAAKYKPAKRQIKHTRVIAAVVAAVILTVSAFAAGGLLTASDIANRSGETTLAEYFENDGGETWSIESQTSGGYTITILGIASGDDMSTYDEEIGLDKTYIVGSIERADGEAITDYTDIMVSPVISGYEPWLVNIFTLNNGSRHKFIQDGVEYFLVETTNVSIFADHTVYIAAYSGALAPTSDVYSLNDDGTISVIGSEGVATLFEIPLDESLADPEAAEELIAKIY
ncbi:MAG: hypothetical protein LUH56_02480 [Oscillospiraceae bacterium]|nr:hypothetical protein [Oscillospiraceae bacterium]